MRYTVAVAGSTHRTAQVAKTLFEDPRFEISLIVTPRPRPIGRKRILTKNPLHAFAEDNALPTLLVDQKLESTLKEKLEKNFARTPFDFLLIVDFGYWIPKWLLDLPRIAPLNIHPSLLPRWRGASPGQYVLLHGDVESAVTLMVMNEFFDEGPVVAQLPFTVNPAWTQTEYYQHAFDLMCAKLADLMEQFAQGKLKAIAQPKISPTMLADKLTKEEAFREWLVIKKAMTDGEQARELERACRAYHPWPKLWTKIPTSQGEKRMILHQCSVDAEGKFVLQEVQIEGYTRKPWGDISHLLH